MLDADSWAHTFRKSSFSESGNCVEVANNDSSVLVRDSKCCDVEALSFSPSAWHEFLHALRSSASIL